MNSFRINKAQTKHQTRNNVISKTTCILTNSTSSSHLCLQDKMAMASRLRNAAARRRIYMRVHAQGGRVMAARLVHAYVNVLKMVISRFLIYLYKIHYLIEWSAGIHLIARLYTFIMWVRFTQLSWNWIDPVWKRKTSHDVVSFTADHIRSHMRTLLTLGIRCQLI